jgi:hypothetical protein
MSALPDKIDLLPARHVPSPRQGQRFDEQSSGCFRVGVRLQSGWRLFFGRSLSSDDAVIVHRHLRLALADAVDDRRWQAATAFIDPAPRRPGQEEPS